MNHTAMLKLGRIFDGVVLHDLDSLPAGRVYFQRGALRLMPNTAVCVDHHEDRRVGIVRELFEHPDTDGVWLAALTTITDPPGWLKRGTPVSLSYINLHTQTLGQASRVLRGLLVEASVLSPGVRPAEARAQVATFHRAEAAGQVIHDPPGTVLRRQTGVVLGVR
jgi:hypothetical protein